MAGTSTQQTQVSTILVEERFFSLPLERARPLIESALASAFGAPLEPLASGMWAASRPVRPGVTLELTARAMQAEGGTTVELRIEHRVSPLVTGAMLCGVIVLSVLVLPVLVFAALAQDTSRRQARERLVLMHKAWTDLADALGPPRAQGYRGEREPPRVRVASEDAAEALEPASFAEPAGERAVR